MLGSGSSWFLQRCHIYQLSSKGSLGLMADKPEEHHDVQPSVIRQEHQAVDKIKAAILSHGNPFAVEGNQLYNLSQMHMYQKNM